MKSEIHAALSKHKRAVVALLLVARSCFGNAPVLDSETTDHILEAEKRWARQNHSAAEGLGVPGDYEEVRHFY